MSVSRLKGQEATLSVISPTGLEVQLGEAVKSLSIEIKMDLLSEGYLGQTTEQKDDLFKGVSGSITLHLTGADYQRFTDSIVARSQRRTAATDRYNINATFAFPDGTRSRSILTDIFFGSPKMEIGSREDYIEASFDFECSSMVNLYNL